MADDAVPELKPHALVVPARGHGHFNGCLLLSRALAEVGFNVSFVCFSSEYANIKMKKQSVSIASLFQITHHEEMADSPASFSQEYPSPCAGGGNTNIHIHVVDDGLVSLDISTFFVATPTMVENLEKLILKLEAVQGKSLTCLISDTFAPWTLPIAKRFGIPRVDYCTGSVMSYLLIIYCPLLHSQGIFPERGGDPTQWKSKTPLMLDQFHGLPPFPSEVYGEFRFAEPSNSFVSIFKEVFSILNSVERILIHTMSEAEPDALHALNEAFGTPAYAIGPLHSYMVEDHEENATAIADPAGSKLHHDEKSDCLAWLDTQDRSSVIYVAFGSFANLSAPEIEELAHGLEASKYPFLWVITDALLGKGDLVQVLPDGFLERTRGKGMIISWAPQVKVLEHKAVGGFLTHCGWNSTLDSLWGGVAMLCCPRMAEQRSNAHIVCNVWQLGIELERTGKGEVERSFVEGGVRALMQGEEGLQARSKAQKMKQIVRKTCQPGGQSFSNLEKFYGDMKALRSQASTHANKIF